MEKRRSVNAMRQPSFQGKKLAMRDKLLVKACRTANRDEEVLAIEDEFDAITDGLVEPERRSARGRKLLRKAPRSARRRG
jgi:hypothetical protein